MRAHGLKVSVIAALLLMVVASISGQTPQQVAKTANTAQIARGEYLVNIAGCPDCHTPMNDKGEFVPGQTLKGTKLFFGPLVKFPVWADTSPNIAGLEGWGTESAIKLLMTGLDPSGHPARPPMPQFHMNHADATAVVAYLKSLK
jgi:mono/diheme cytochrome c family protein